MKKLLLCFLLTTVANDVLAQQEVKPSISRLNGLWRFQDRTFISYLINRSNKSLKISYWTDDKNASVYGTPFSYFGFWNTQKPNYPKRLSELDSVGTNIFFYDDLGQNYDSLGNLLRYSARTCWMTYNEDEEPNHEPAVLRFYHKGTPDVYVRVKTIPDSILLALKQNPKSWKNYTAFIGMTQKTIRTKQATIYQSPNIASRAYLVAGDEVELLEEANDWYRIRYYGKSVIEGWLRRIDIE